ncbi:MAG: T9SS type A sorting domain-containing protein [Balneolales bacterium]|nr:T9SS type A sorting domain-containing protein [Balneolales bacterium]
MKYLIFIVTLLIAQTLTANPVDRFKQVPFSVDETHITVWNGTHYTPLFIKGINLGIGVPGTFPGEMAATREQYMRWFEYMHEAGFNTIRVYTLHYPRFYDALYEYNSQNPQYPILLMHGVWLEEEAEGFDGNLYQLTDLFDQEMRENVRAVHGDITIPERRGKAHGTYTKDISQWVISYIIGREVYPSEVIYTNDLYPSITSFEGEYFSIENTFASEAWFIERLDNLVRFEQDEYGTQRPVSFSSWPTLDPIDHPTEINTDEDIVSLDISEVDFSRAEAGIFASYHAYPYYPDYISRDPRYTIFSDHLGQNSYVGYLTYLKEHYSRFPLIIAEFGAPSSWGNAHYAHNGIHHGGYDETEQGKNSMRLMQNIQQAGGGGGILFAWLDEWFKITWITDPMDFDPERRIIWHNVTAAEQNYGMLGFRKPPSDLQTWETFCEDCPVKSIKAGSDYAYLKFELEMDRHIGALDTVWVSLDTYDANLGESILPNGVTVSNRAEFVLMITNYTAELYVTEAYDIYGIWHGTSSPAQQFRSVVSDGAPWRIVRWKNNQAEKEVQYIGQMKVNRLGLPQSSTDAVRLFDDKIEIRLPWTLLNIVDPSRAQVMHYDRGIDMRNTITSDGVHVGVYYNGEAYITNSRYTWESWNHALDAEEYKKESFFVVKEELPKLPANPIARGNHYAVGVGSSNFISADIGVLSNDWSPDGVPMIAVVDQMPEFGLLNLRPDGSFSYIAAQDDLQEDSFTYRVRAGSHWSDAATVTLSGDGEPMQGSGFVQVYPKTSTGPISIRSASIIDRVEVYAITGQRVLSMPVNARNTSLELDFLNSGVYFVRLHSRDDTTIRKITIYRAR